MSRYVDFWEFFGLTPLTIWDLLFRDFIEMCYAADQIRAEQKRRAEA